MDADRFDSLLRSLATSPSRRSALRLLAGSALGSLLMGDPLSAAAKKKGGKKGGGKKKCKGKGKVTICHKGQTMRVSACAVKGHKKHGDKVGACQDPPPPGCTKLGLNADCTSHGQCCSNFCGDGTCRAAGSCTEQGNPCTGTAAACCAGVCNAGGSDIDGTANACAACRTGGAACSSPETTDTCCGDRTCVDAGDADVCCSLLTEACDSDLNDTACCAPGAVCADAGTVAGTCCLESGTCETDAQCCTGNCNAQACIPCKDAGSLNQCDNDLECCSVAICNSNTLRCCNPNPGDPCTSNAQCCSGNCDTDISECL